MTRPQYPAVSRDNVPDNTLFYIPDDFIGNPIEPNFYCRAWNSKRNKYCRARAGQGTEHVGEGRCWVHDGGHATLKHGRYSNHVSGNVRDLMTEMDQETDEEKLDTTDEVMLMRAIAINFSNKYHEIVDALLAWNAEEFEKAAESKRKPMPQRIPDMHEVTQVLERAVIAVDKIHRQRAIAAIPKKDFARVMRAMGEIVETEVRELEEKRILSPTDADQLLKKISTAWKKIRIGK